MKKREIFFIIAIIILTAVLILFLNYDNILKWQYERAVKNKDCEKIYDMIEVEVGKYLSKEKYISQCKLKISDYKNYEIKVENHKIKNDIVNIYNNITFYIPSDSDFYLDDRLINDNFIIDDKNIYKVFTIDKLYEGEYNVKFANQSDEEIDKIIVSQNNVEGRFEYNNAKQIVTVIGHNSCSYCTKLLSFLSSLDNSIFQVNYYDIYASGNSDYKKETQRAIKEFSQYYNNDVKYYPTVVIGDKYILGYSDSLEKDYIDAIYYYYRNEIDTVVR